MAHTSYSDARLPMLTVGRTTVNVRKPAMRHAAFFRNLNLGRRNCPDRRQFEAAFLDSDAVTANSLPVNGTIAV